MKKIYIYSLTYSLFILFLTLTASAQVFHRELTFKSGGTVEIKNFYGRVDVQAQEEIEGTVSISAAANASVSESEIKSDSAGGRIKIEVSPDGSQKRIDLTVKLPAGSQIKVETRDGEVRISGNLAHAEIKTETGTIAADVPLENLQYNFVWTASRPRFMSDRELEEVQEKSAGRFVLKERWQKKILKRASKPENPK